MEQSNFCFYKYFLMEVCMRLKTCLTTAAAAVTLLLAGCSNVTTDAGRIPDAGAAERTVVFSVENIPTDYDAMIRSAQTDASRELFSILPDQPFVPSSPHLVFMLQGKANNGASFVETDITLTHAAPTAPYTFQQNLQAALWDLTLTAYKEASAGTADTAQPVLRGHCTADLSNGSAQVTFNMSTRNLTTPGTVKITGDVKDPDGICKHYEIGMYHANTGKFVEKYTKPTGGTENTNAKQDYDAAPSGGQFDFHYGDDSLPTPDQKVTLNAGAYEFRMIFYKGAAPNWIPIGSYSDIIVVNPGNDLVQTLHIGDVMNKKPTAPEDLRAYLVDNTEDTEGRYYQAKLTWKKAKFETNYEVELTTYTDDGTAPNPPKEVYGFKETMDASTAKEWGDSPVRYASSLGWATE